MLVFDRVDSVLDLDENGAPIAYDLQFEADVAVARTFTYTNVVEKDVHMYVDLDDENMPVAVSLVHPANTKVFEYATVSKKSPEYREKVAEIYRYVWQLTTWSRAFRPDSFKIEDLSEGQEIAVKTSQKVRALETYELAMT